MTESLFPEFDPEQLYPFHFAALDVGRMVERAIGADRVDQLKEAIAQGWINKETRCFDNSTVIARCNYRGAKKCAEYLRAQGWPERTTKERAVA